MKQQILSIQYLRCAAAASVAVFHTGWSRVTTGPSSVALFFVISGFIMMYITKPDMTPRSFLWARFRRVVPLYWVLTLVAAFIYSATVWQTFLSMTFCLSVPGTFRNWPIIFQAWTLNYEVFFYLIFSGSLLLRPALRLPFISGVIVTIVVTGKLFQGGLLFEAFTNPVMLEFLLGAWLCEGFKRGIVPVGKGAYAILEIGLLLLLCQFNTALYDQWSVSGLWGAPWVLVIAGLLSLEQTRRVPYIPLIKLIGDCSFALYLTHTWINNLLHPVLIQYPLPIALGAYLVACSVFAVAIHFLVEKPLLDMLKPTVRRVEL